MCPTSPIHDPELAAVAEQLRRMDPLGLRTARTLRESLDQIYDGQRTGRYRWDQLHKTEKTYFGTLVEINLHKAFNFEDGQVLDYRIGGSEVDCKFSQQLGGWMLPPEALSQLCILVWASDESARWSMGLVRVCDDVLRAGRNRDLKASLSAAGRDSIRWLFDHAPLPGNVLLQLERGVVDRIMSLKSGQQRINEIFRVAQGKIVGRGVVATLGQQDDYMKRIRANGGARTRLQHEGIIILGQWRSHAAIAKALGVPVPGCGDSLSVRVARADTRGLGAAEIRGTLWRVATPDDPVVEAPALPSANDE